MSLFYQPWEFFQKTVHWLFFIFHYTIYGKPVTVRVDFEELVGNDQKIDVWSIVKLPSASKIVHELWRGFSVLFLLKVPLRYLERKTNRFEAGQLLEAVVASLWEALQDPDQNGVVRNLALLLKSFKLLWLFVLCIEGGHDKALIVEF